MTNAMTPLSGLTSVNEYLDTRHHIDKNVTSNINEFGRVVFQAGYDFSTKEIMCNLLSGRGLLLPNLQICLSVNLKAMLGIDGLQTQLIKSLSSLDSAVDDFIQHTDISNILGRLNSALSEVSQIASMINFCGTPITPIPITNTLENSMQSFLGKGKEVINKIGTMVPDEIGGCLAFDGQDFNLSLFGGGILGDLAGMWDRVKSGGLTQTELDLIDDRINDVIAEIDTIITDENNTNSVTDLGGSDFTNNFDIPLNTELGVVFNPSSAGIQGTASIASQLKSLYDKFAAYPVIDANGKVYDNVFRLILDDTMINLLQSPTNPVPAISTREPIYNYCGNIIGYNTTTTQSAPSYSEGVPPINHNISNNPGFMSNGLNAPSTDIVMVSTAVEELVDNAIVKSKLVGTPNQITVTTADTINPETTIAAVVATQIQAEAGTDNVSLMTPLRTAEVITSSLSTQPDAEAGTDNVSLMTPLRTAQAISALSIISKYYESPVTDISLDTLYTFTHGLGELPKMMQAYYVCKVATMGYSVGDYIPISHGTENYNNNVGPAIAMSTTTIKVRIPSDAIMRSIGLDGTTRTAINATSFDLVVRAWA